MALFPLRHPSLSCSSHTSCHNSGRNLLRDPSVDLSRIMKSYHVNLQAYSLFDYSSLDYLPLDYTPLDYISLDYSSSDYFGTSACLA